MGLLLLILMLFSFHLSGGEERIEKVGLSSARVVIERGREYFHSLRGTTGYTCASCHGVNGEFLRGVYARMPRYYTDLGKVADADLRIKACLQKYVGLPENLEGKEGRRYVVPLVGFVASLSDGEYVSVELKYEEEKKLYELGRRLWNRRSGALDLSCSACHEQLAGKRFGEKRLSFLKQENRPARWPVYSLSRDELLTLEDMLRECYERMLLYDPEKGGFSPTRNWIRRPPYYIEELIALQLYLMYSVRGVRLNVPGVIK
ncbi:MAG: sulfur oxidation c-type cytochrome SoxA [Aquificae bacterium]|nr:sulfur oxidation c-type cytochrome SoxA [Aquificota bacterium]